MYRLRVEVDFDAAHRLEGYPGKCANLHGHSWKVEVFVTGEAVDSLGLVCDFGMLKQELE